MRREREVSARRSLGEEGHAQRTRHTKLRAKQTKKNARTAHRPSRDREALM